VSCSSDNQPAARISLWVALCPTSAATGQMAQITLPYHNVTNDHVSSCHLCKFDIDSPWLATLFISDHEHPMVYCVRCNQSFPNNRVLQQHKENSNAHWICNDCRIDFGSSDSRREHYVKSRKHHYCGECNRLFESDESRVQHMEAKHSYCRMHDRVSILPLPLPGV
jgi:hypothetical protein